MKVIATELPEVQLVEPVVHRDDRGFFLESWQAARYAEAGIEGPFVQDNHSRSLRGTLRGLHLQLVRPQGKLIRVTRGEILDVAVDVRRGSPRFGRFVAVRLDDQTHQQLWIPEGFAHGFCVLSDVAEMQYKCTRPYDPESELAIAWNDPAIGIPWPIDDPLLSDKDRAGRLLSACAELPLPAYPGPS